MVSRLSGGENSWHVLEFLDKDFLLRVCMSSSMWFMTLWQNTADLKVLELACSYLL